ADVGEGAHALGDVDGVGLGGRLASVRQLLADLALAVVLLQDDLAPVELELGVEVGGQVVQRAGDRVGGVGEAGRVVLARDLLDGLLDARGVVSGDPVGDGDGRSGHAFTGAPAVVARERQAWRRVGVAGHLRAIACLHHTRGGLATGPGALRARSTAGDAPGSPRRSCGPRGAGNRGGALARYPTPA